MPTHTHTLTSLFKNSRGILSLDEGLDRMKERFLKARFSLSESSQRSYLELMLNTTELPKYIGAVTLSDQAARMLDTEAEVMLKRVRKQNLVLGIRADFGYDRSSLLRKEVVTRGLTDLNKRLAEYKKWGAQYVKWRTKYYITYSTPSQTNIELNNQEALEFVIMTLKHKMTPVVQLKISTNGSQNMQATADVMSIILDDFFSRVEIAGIDPELIVIKTGFITPGSQSAQSVSAHQVAEITYKVLKKSIPASIGGVTFVADGLRPGFARMYLEAFRHYMKKQTVRFPTSYAFGRGLHDGAISIWAGDKNRVSDAQISLVQNARLDWSANN